MFVSRASFLFPVVMQGSLIFGNDIIAACLAMKVMNDDDFD